MNLIEMEGFLRGKCLPGDIKTGESNAEYLVRKFSELHEQLSESQREFRSADITMQNLEAQLKQSKIDADCYKKGMEASNARLVQLAAENAKLADCANFYRLGFKPAKGAFGIEYRPTEQLLDDCGNTALEAIKTPATDAFLAEVRAQARNELIDELEARFTELSQSSPTPELRSGAAGAAGFVSTFRKGVQS
ncbi:TPA: hNH endonuclease [Citrobacter amalonaticus]|nr:hNH endonuclease [Citrobacter amalonaticus]